MNGTGEWKKSLIAINIANSLENDHVRTCVQ